jgi:23S rRNA pseudouridine2605 synthase
MAEQPDPRLPTGDRLQKVLARMGVGSRRVCEDLITDGRVTVNGMVPVLGRRIDPAVDRVELDGVPLPIQPGLVHYLVNKPAGVVSTAEDTHGRPTVVSLVPGHPRVFPVGRLDMDSEGLLILTNDGDLTHRLTHPSFGVPKEYLVEVEGEPTAGQVRRLRHGLDLDDGPTAPARVAVVAPTLLRMVIHEGRNRQIRRMCEAVGHPVLRLVRTRIGSLIDPSLGPGAWRPLTFDEVRGLAAAATSWESGAEPTPAGGKGGGGAQRTSDVPE